MKKVILGGFLMGAIAAGVFHQGTLFLLQHMGHWVPMLTEAVGRPAFTGWELHRTIPGYGLPLLAGQLAVGGLWGIVIAAVMRFTPVPDLLLGMMIGVVAGIAFPSVLDQGTTVARAALAGAGFGWGCAILLRPIEVRRYATLKMRHQFAPKD